MYGGNLGIKVIMASHLGDGVHSPVDGLSTITGHLQPLLP